MENSEKRNIKNEIHLMESNIESLLTRLCTLYGFIGEDVRLSIKKDDFGLIENKPNHVYAPGPGGKIQNPCPKCGAELQSGLIINEGYTCLNGHQFDNNLEQL